MAKRMVFRLSLVSVLVATTSCSTDRMAQSGVSQRVATQDVRDLEDRCQPAAVQAVASALSTAVTVAQIPNGPVFPGGTKYFPETDKLPAFCQVTGRFVTNSATGKTANFVATFPANWNGKYLQMGCSGHCGGIYINDANSPSATIGNQGYPRDPIAKGYASFGTDQGHVGNTSGAWAVKSSGQVDEDSVTDFLYRANKVLARMGKDFTRTFYSQATNIKPTIARSYFNGCSNGGRDALVAASYFPEEFDGIIGGSPYANMAKVAFQYAGGSLAAIRTPDADVSPSLLKLMKPIVTAQCDRIDGVEDGLIQNPAACDFRPERDLPRCGSGNAPTDQCFTPAQIETVSTWITAVTDEDGKVVQPGMSVSELMTGLRMTSRPVDPAAAEPWVSDVGPAQQMWSLANANLKIFSRKNDPGFHVRPLFSFRSGGPGNITAYRAIVPKAEVARAEAALRMGIGTFPENADRLIRLNRKFLIWTNLSDELLSPYMSIRYYNSLASRHGGYAKLQKNIRLFGIPGSGHCSMSGVGPNKFDALAALENWVEKGIAPDALIANLYDSGRSSFDPSKKALRTMPLCKFPVMARYKGQGDVNDAANWSCPSGDTSMLKIGESGRRAGVVN